MRGYPIRDARWLLISLPMLAGVVHAASPTPPNPAFYDAIWVGSTSGLAKVNADDGVLQFTIGDIGDVTAVTVDDVQNRVWAFSGGNLRSYDFDGSPGITLPISPRPPLVAPVAANPVPEDVADADDLEDLYCAANGEVPDKVSPNALWPLAKLAASPEDGSVWVGIGNHLLQVSPEGATLNDITVPGLITGLTVDPGKFRVWVATCQKLIAYELEGTVAKQVVAGGQLYWQKDITFDSTAQYLWLSLRNHLDRYDSSGNQQLHKAQFQVENVASDRHGFVWTSVGSMLRYLDSDGVVLKTVNPFVSDGGINIAGQRPLEAVHKCFGADVLEPQPIFLTDKSCDIVALAAHPAARYAIAAIRSVISEVGTNGSVLRRIPLTTLGAAVTDKVRSLGLYADIFPPTVQIVSPRNGQVFGIDGNDCFMNESDATFCLKLTYDDVGIGEDSDSLAITINGVPFNSSFCNLRSDRATCFVAQGDGPVASTATIHDHAGNLSQTAASNFILDNYQPGILLDEVPALINNPQLTLGGYITEPGMLKMNGSSVPVSADLHFVIGPLTLVEGDNLFEFVVTDTANNTNSALLPVRLDSIPPPKPLAPKIEIVHRGDGSNQTRVAGAAGSVEAEAAVTVTNQRTGQQFVTTANSDGSFALDIAAQIGDALRISATDAASNQSQVLSLQVQEAFFIFLSSPSVGANVPDDVVTVTGELLAPPNTGLAINGHPVANARGAFAYALQLTPSAQNTITVVAKHPDGRTATKTVTVSSGAPAPFSLTLSPESGVAPQQVSFRVENSSTEAITQILLTPEGTGDDPPVTDLSQPLVHTYTTPGIHYASVTVYYAGGGVYTKTVPIVIVDAAQIDADIQVVWKDFIDALLATDKSKAISMMSADSRELYGSVFDALMSHMTEILGEFTGIHAMNISTDLSSYAVLTVRNGTTQVFIINLTKDEDGIWRIESL